VDCHPDVRVVVFTPRMVCTRCGVIGADARPDWTERLAIVGASNIGAPIV
jgi:hypothetical protein